MQYLLQRALLLLLAAAFLSTAPGRAEADYLDDNTAFNKAISELRSAIGDHARVLQITADPEGVEVEAQDPHNLSHIDRWRYGVVTYLQLLSMNQLSGPDPVEPELVNPDLEANLFDFAAIDFSAAPKLMQGAIKRAGLQDAATVTRMEIERRTFILPKPSSGEVRWTVYVSSGREHAEIYADAQGFILSADLSGTERAKHLNLLREPELVADAAAEFREVVGAGPVLTEVGVEEKEVSFATNIPDQTIHQLGMGMPATQIFTWDLNGLQRQLGRIDVNAEMGTPSSLPFRIEDVDWTILAKLEKDALAKAALPQADITSLEVAKSTDRPGGPVLVWTVELTEPSGDVTSVTADTHGAIEHVLLPPTRRPPVDWLSAATIAGAIAKVGATFGPATKITSIVFDDRGGRITIEDPANNNQAQTFDLAEDGATRSGITFQLDSSGARFGVPDLAPLDEKMIAKLEAEAMKRLGGQKPGYLESVSIGAHPFEPQAGAHAIEVRIRDIPQDSAQANYAWIVFDFNGQVVDFVTF
jgi:hypothetical protein